MVNGSTTKVTDFANSKPLNCMAMVEGLGQIKYPDCVEGLESGNISTYYLSFPSYCIHFCENSCPCSWIIA